MYIAYRYLTREMIMDNVRITAPRLSTIYVCAIVCAWSLAFGSCAAGLDPIAQSRAASVLITIPGTSTTATSSGGDGASRALASDSGFLYVQTGITAETAKLYGPYQATPGETVTIADIPGATYPAVALLYAPEIPASPLTAIIPVEPTLEAMRLAAQAALSAYPEICVASSVGLVENFTVLWGERNTLSATLVPTTALGVTGNSSISLVFPDARRTGQFIRLTGAKPLFPSTGSSPMSLVWNVLNDSTAPVTVSGVSLYSSSGAFLGRDATEIVLAPGSCRAFPFAWSGDDAYYGYLDARGGKVTLFASAADSGPAMNGALQILDRSSGNAEYANEVTVDLSIPYGLAGSGISSIALSGDASFTAATRVDGNAIASWTATTLNLATPIVGTGKIVIHDVTLATGEGPKTASVRLSDALGNGQVVSDAIQASYRAASTVLDTVPPGIPSFSAFHTCQYMGVIYIPASPSLVTCYAIDDNNDGDDDEEDGSGIAGYSFDSAGSAAWKDTFTVSDGQTVTIYAIDRAGNVSPPFTINVVLDNTAPAISSVGIGSGCDLRVSYVNEPGGCPIGFTGMAYNATTYMVPQPSGIGAMAYQDVGTLIGGSYIETWHLPAAAAFPEYLYIQYTIPDSCGNATVGYAMRYYDGTVYTFTQVSP